MPQINQKVMDGIKTILLDARDDKDESERAELAEELNFMEASIWELGYDSTMALTLVVEIKKRFGIEITQPTSKQENQKWFKNIATVGRMYDYILTNLPEDSPFRKENVSA